VNYIDIFERQHQAGIALDESQRQAAQRLQRLWDALLAETGEGWGRRIGTRLGLMPAKDPSGVYIYGPVGRGKSMLMDMFFTTLPIARKRRVHFHAFMQEIHTRLHERRESLPDLALALAASTRLLCFDEFEVKDIADAMILARLFTALFDAGIIVVATSNRAPEALYADGLQRERFLPFIALLEERLDLIALDNGRDYRRARLEGRPVYFTPLGPAASAALDAAFAELTGGARPERAMLAVQGRKLLVPSAAKGVARFSFAELCVAPLGPADYLALCAHYHTLLIDGIPRFSRETANEARRFIILIDTLYQAHGNLVAAAAAAAPELYREGEFMFEFERTASRLIEMQSAAYIAARQVSFTSRN